MHVLSTPPAFVLSQDQTLRRCSITGRETRADTLVIHQPKESHPHPQGRGTGILLGTDFRHAVEFSRSGRATTPASRPSSWATSRCYAVLCIGLSPGGSTGWPSGPLGAWRTIHQSAGPCTGGLETRSRRRGHGVSTPGYPPLFPRTPGDLRARGGSRSPLSGQGARRPRAPPAAPRA